MIAGRRQTARIPGSPIHRKLAGPRLRPPARTRQVLRGIKQMMAKGVFPGVAQEAPVGSARK